MTDIRQQKSDLRAIMKERRAKAQAENPQAGAELRDQVLASILLPPQAIIAGYMPMGSEIDPLPLMESLSARGHTIVLPVVIEKKQPLLFRRYITGDPLAASDFHVKEPLSSAPVAEPDVLLVPLLAFDHRLHRLGYGGGFYDRTIESLRRRKPLLTLGIAFACQEIPQIPRGTHDARLDKIATEIQVFR